MQTKSDSLADIPLSGDRQKIVNDKIRWMEEKYDLLQYNVDGWCAWPLLRIWLHREVMGIGLRSERTRINLFNQVGFAIKSVQSFFSLRTTKYLIKTYSSARLERVDHLFKDIYFDDLLDVLTDYIKVETINNNAMLKRSMKALHPSGLYTSLFALINLTIRNLCFTRLRYQTISQKISDIILHELKISIKPVVIADYFARFFWGIRIYGYILDRVKPKSILTADPSEFSLLAAASSKKINTIELAHAMCNRYHAAYSWNDYARQYMQFMPLPGKILVYGSYMKDELESWGFWPGRIISVGSLRLDNFRATHAGMRKDGFCTLTWTTQGIREDQLFIFINEFLDLCKLNSFDVHLNIKLHPVYDPDPGFYHHRFFKNKRQITVIGASTEPSTYELITKSHYHLSISSSCHYEALGLEVPTIILPFGNYRYFMDLVNSGHAYLPQTPRELLNIISSPDTQKVPANIRERYYKTGALRNILAEIH